MKIDRFFAILLLAPLFLVSVGCAAAFFPVAVATGAFAGTQVVNILRDQYPDVDFDAPAPVEAVYDRPYDEVWDNIVDTLFLLDESIAVASKDSGVIRTQKKNLNKVGGIGKALGKATFRYEYSIVLRKTAEEVVVKTDVAFWEEKMYLMSKEMDAPDMANVMRHIFYWNLDQKIKPARVRMSL